jgi:ribosomal protein L11 methyltransferase
LEKPEDIKKKIINLISEKEIKTSSFEIKKVLFNKYFLKKNISTLLIKELVEEGALEYTNMFGRTFLELSYQKPIHVSDQVVLKPPHIKYNPKPGEKIINLNQGISFGNGSHSTTRLCIRGIEKAWKCRYINTTGSNALDIGTGSGVLAITSIMFGVEKATGIDKDQCSIKEARDNVRLNCFQDRIKIKETPIENINTKFTLISANLRMPTIKELYSKINEITNINGCVVISGIKKYEMKGVRDLYCKKHFDCIWSDTQKDWSVILLRKTS